MSNDTDIVSDIMRVWGGCDDFRDGGLEYVAFVQEENIRDMRESSFDETVCVKELADQAIVSLRQLEEMGYDPYSTVKNRLSSRMDGKTEAVINKYQRAFELLKETSGESVHRYGFSSPLPESVVSADKTATARYNDHRRVVPGDIIIATDTNDETFALLKAKTVAEVPAGDVPDFIESIGAKHSCVGSDSIAGSLRQYYPGEEIIDTTPIQVIHFELLEEI